MHCSFRWVLPSGSARIHESPRIPETFMGKLGWTALIVLGAAFAADQYLNYGYYTDSTLNMLREVRRSFGW
jgi:hypothetical protein